MILYIVIILYYECRLMGLSFKVKSKLILIFKKFKMGEHMNERWTLLFQINEIRKITWIGNWFADLVWINFLQPVQEKKIKDRRDVSQFKIIFLDILFLLYLHLNMFMPKHSGCIARLFLELDYFECFF